MYVVCAVVHSHTFVQSLVCPGSVAPVHMDPFWWWAGRMGLVLELSAVPYQQLAPIPLPNPSFLQARLKAYSVIRKWGGGDMPAAPPPPLHAPLCYQSGIRLCFKINFA